jgi:hypothetical protein
MCLARTKLFHEQAKAEHITVGTLQRMTAFNPGNVQPLSIEEATEWTTRWAGAAPNAGAAGGGAAGAAGGAS